MYIKENEYLELEKTNPNAIIEYSKRVLYEYSFMLCGTRFFVNIENLKEIIIDIPEQEILLKNRLGSKTDLIVIENIIDTHYFYECEIIPEVTLFNTIYYLSPNKISKLVFDFDDDD